MVVYCQSLLALSSARELVLLEDRSRRILVLERWPRGGDAGTCLTLGCSCLLTLAGVLKQLQAGPMLSHCKAISPQLYDGCEHKHLLQDRNVDVPIVWGVVGTSLSSGTPGGVPHGTSAPSCCRR